MEYNNCSCHDGYRGSGTICDDIDECKEQRHDYDKNGKCFNIMGSFNCVCNSGFRGNGTSCEDIDECLEKTNNCHKEATCVAITMELIYVNANMVTKAMEQHAMASIIQHLFLSVFIILNLLAFVSSEN